MDQQDDTSASVRLIESWLPLVQAENMRNGWGHDGLTLETLIMTAAPALQHATNTLSARAILWHCRSQLGKEQA